MAYQYKLSYSSKSAGNNDLKIKGVLEDIQDEDNIIHTVFAPKTHAVVYLGHIELEKAEMDGDGNITKDAVLSPRYHIDVMTDAQIDFGAAIENIPEGQKPYHTF